MNHAQFWGGGGAALYEIDQSLRFNSADSFSFRRTPSSNSTSQKKFTFSVWSKRGVINSGTANNTGRQSIAYTGLSSGSGNLFSLEWREDEVACLFNGAGTIWPQTTAKFRDPSAWYHIVVAVDTDQTTTTDRCKIYVNGVQQTLTGTFPGAGFAVTNGSATGTIHSVGEVGSLRSNQYLAEVYYINDQQLAPTDFAETNNDGVWVPKEYTGTFTGTNSYYLKFDPSATNGIGHDHSGNGNNFTTTNFTTSGTGTDVMSDTPTTNWCTLNPLDFQDVNYKPTLSEGNLKSQNTSSRALGTIAIPSSGKYYFEGKVATVGSSTAQFGVETAAWGSNGYMYYDSTNTYLSTYTTETLGIAVNVDDGEVTFYKNNTSQGTTSVSTLPGAKPFLNHGGNWVWTINFGQHAFTYTPPTGYVALNTSNLPAPTVKDGSDYFNTVLWTGNATARNITTGHNSNFTWIKHRNSAENHNLYDILRGVGNRLESNSKASQTSYADRLTAFNTDGFSLGTGYNNTNTTTYVGWSWAGGGSGSSNPNGSINSTVSASSSSGFSIVSWTGQGGGANTIGHGLGDAPKMIIVKAATDNTYNWNVYHHGIDATAPEDYFISLNLTSARGGYTLANTWNRTQPTNTVFSVNSVATAGATGVTMIAYCFAEVENYSRIGSYVGNGNADGPFVYCGFKPKWLMVKLSTTAGYWVMIDAARNTFNAVDDELVANTNHTENGLAITTAVDFTSNGFKIRTSDANLNSNTQTLIFAAFAEHPLGGAGVSPVTAR